jgi:hypothetical protein
MSLKLEAGFRFDAAFGGSANRWLYAIWRQRTSLAFGLYYLNPAGFVCGAH